MDGQRGTPGHGSPDGYGGPGRRGGRPGRPRQDPARRRERAHRILDATAELVLRWGYDKTTIDDIARRADVAKGTIYLHWTTRDALFAALLRRERLATLTRVRDGMAADPDAGTLRDLLRRMALELLRRPLMRAALLGDSEVLGKLTRQKRAAELPEPTREAFADYLAELLRHGAVRADLSPVEHVNVLVSVIYGFLMVPGMLPDAYRLPDERLADLLADAGERALGTGREPPDRERAAIRAATRTYVDRVTGLAERKLARSLGDDAAPRPAEPAVETEGDPHR